ncbi:hypothetical protein, partial [Pseudomonas sp. GW531-E2]|uniref:hypothetical protein n=1 Tax=Pseudomonas sp. GW531-E2 TaxID=2070679 RepID=UPI001C47840F
NYMVGDDFQLIEISNATGNVCTDAFLDCRKNKQSFMDQGPGHANDNAPQLNFDQPTGFPPRTCGDSLSRCNVIDSHSRAPNPGLGVR